MSSSFASRSFASLSEHAEFLIYLVVARAISRRLSPEQILKIAAQSGALFEKVSVECSGIASKQLEAMAWRSSRLLPAVDCVDRALAARVFLARRGASAVVVIGMRRGAREWEGHAWLERGSGELLFVSGTDAYREVAREA